MSQLGVQYAPQGAGAGSRAAAVNAQADIAPSGRAHEALPATAGSRGGKTLPPSADPVSAQRRQQVLAESREHVEKAIAHLNHYVRSIQRDLQFFVDEGSGEAVVQVIDRSTQEVVRQIPSDVALRLARNLEVHLAEQAQYASDAIAGEVPAVAGLSLIDTRI